MKRHISLILALITAGTLASCGDDTGPVQTDSALADAPTDTPETDIYSSLPTGNYGGAEFKILNNISNFAYTLMDLESETGDVLDDAVYQRTRSVEDRLGVKISVTDLGWDEALDMIKSQIMSGDDGYDICFDEVSTLALAYEPGMFTDIGTISTVDLTKPWWNRMANDSIRVGDATYYLFGDIHLMLWECYMPVVANLTLAESLGIDDLYDTVESGKWTLDTMYSCMRSAALDLNGDTKTDAEDRFGLSMYPWNAMSFFTGCGVSLIEKESDGIPVYTGVTERFSAVYEKLALGFLSDKFHPIRTGMVSMALQTVILFIGGRIATTESVFAWLFLVQGISIMSYNTLMASYAPRLFPREYFAQFNSAMMLINALASVIGAPLVGKFLDLTGNYYPHLFTIGGVIGLCGLGCFVMVYRGYQRYGGDSGYIAPAPTV